MCVCVWGGISRRKVDRGGKTGRCKIEKGEFIVDVSKEAVRGLVQGGKR